MKMDLLAKGVVRAEKWRAAAGCEAQLRGEGFAVGSMLSNSPGQCGLSESRGLQPLGKKEFKKKTGCLSN